VVQWLVGEEVPFQCLGQAVLVAFDFEDLDCFVGGAGGEAAAVVVEDGIVLCAEVVVSQLSGMRLGIAGGVLDVRSCHHDRSWILLVPERR